MEIITALGTALATGAAKHLAKAVLGQEWQDQISEELVDLGVARLLKQREIDPDDGAKEIGKRLETVCTNSKLADNEKESVSREVVLTLARADTRPERLIEMGLDAARLKRDLIGARPEATEQFSNDEAALYGRMLGAAADGLVQTIGLLDSFQIALAQASLSHQRKIQDQQQNIDQKINAVFKFANNWLQEADEAAHRFYDKSYKPQVERKLNKLEPFGIDEVDALGEQFKLKDSFIIPDLMRFVWIEEQHPETREEHPSSSKIGRWEERRDDIFETLAQARRLMIIGTAGSGKSTLLQWLAIQAVNQTFPEQLDEWNQLIPFFIRLRDYKDESFPTPEQFPQKLVRADEAPEGWVRGVLERGEGLLLVDGVDEMPQAERDQMLDALQELVSRYPLSRFVVSSRPPTVNETRWPKWEKWLQEAFFTKTWLPDMSREQTQQFVRRWHEALKRQFDQTEEAEERTKAEKSAGGLLKLLQRNSALRKLASTPLLCGVICALYDAQGDSISSKRLDLYENCVEMLLWYRDRKHKRRKVPALRDYPEFERKKLMNLISYLAYWMMDEGQSEIEKKRVKKHFKRYLPKLGMEKGLSTKAFEYFHDRASLWNSPLVGYVEFRHRTFQEYLAAGWAMQQDKVGALAEKGLKPEWRETIVLAAGHAKPKQAWKLLKKLLKRAKAAERSQDRRYLLLLALGCLETCTELPKGKHWKQVMAAARPLFPPHSREEAESLAKAGQRAIKLLSYDSDYPNEIAGYCIEALAAIGGEAAMQTIAAYNQDDRWLVRRALGAAWERFEAGTYARQILSQQDSPTLFEWPAHADWQQQLSNLTSLNLDLRSTAVSDISPLQQLSNLTSLTLYLRSTAVSDIFPLQQLSNLTSLTLDLRYNKAVSDISPLQQLSNLTSLNLDLSSTAVSDISPLQQLSNLTSLTLDLSYNKAVSDISPLQQLSNLTSLTLDLSSAVSDISPLQQLSNLTSLNLDLSDNKAVSDISPLQQLSNLTSLTLYLSSAVSDISPLQQLSNLTSLNLDLSSAVSDISPLINLSELTHLGLGAMIRLNRQGRVDRVYSWGGVRAELVDVRALLGLEKLRVLALPKDFSMPERMPEVRRRKRGLAIYRGERLYRYWPAR